MLENQNMINEFFEKNKKIGSQKIRQKCLNKQSFLLDVFFLI